MQSNSSLRAQRSNLPRHCECNNAVHPVIASEAKQSILTLYYIIVIYSQKILYICYNIYPIMIMDMHNCLQKKSAPLLKKLALRRLLAGLFVFMMILTNAQAETYFWLGGATTPEGDPDNNWSTLANWNTALDGSGSTPAAAPGAGDTTYFPKDATVILDSDITVTELRIPAPNLETGFFEVELSGSHSITVTSKIETFRSAATGAADNATSTLIFNCDVTSPSLIMHSGGNITLEAGKTASITNIVNQGEDSPATMLTVNGSLTSNSIQMSPVTTRLLTVSSTGSITANSLTGSAGSVTNNGLIVTQTAVDSSLVGSGNAPVTPSAGEIVWTGAASNAWATAGNWAGGSVPSNTDKIKIPASAPNKPVITTAVTIDDTANLTIDTGTNITVNGSGSLTLTTGTFDISKINNNSTGTLIFSGNYSHSSDDYSAPNLAIVCGGNLTVSKNLECKSIIVTGTSTLNNSSGITYLVARGNDGINFGNTVTVNASGSQFILGGNVTSTGAVNVEIASGMLNHVEETTSHNKTWGTNLTTDLKADGTTFGMAQGSSYQTKIEAGSGDVYFVGNGTIASLDDNSTNCNIHFGNADSTQNNTLTFSSNIAFSTSGKIIFDESCSGLSGSVTLSGINKIENKSTKLTNTLGVNFSLNSGAEISGVSATANAIKFNDLTFAGTATVGVNIENSGTLSASGAVTFNKDYTNKGTANFTGNLQVAGNFTDSGTAFSGDITLNGTDSQIFKGGTATPGYDVIINKSSGGVEFTNALTLNSLDTSTNSYTGNITFNGTGTQTITPQSGIYKSITVNKTSGTLTVNGDLQTESLTLSAGAVSFGGNLTLWDGTIYSDANFTTTSNINFTGGTSSSPRTLKAKSITTAGSIICSDGATAGSGSSCLKLETTDGNISIGSNIGGPSNYYNTVVLDSGTKDITITGKIYTFDISVTCNNVEFSNSIYTGNVSITAANTLSIKNGLEAATLTINPGAQTIKMGGTIKLTDASQDFVIDYPLLLSANTSFDIAGNIIINDSASPAKVGSINSETTARTLTLKAGSGKSIQIQNGTSTGAGFGNTNQLSTITINSSLELSADTTFKTSGTNGTTFAGTGTLTLGGSGGTLSTTGNLRNNGSWTINRPLIINGNFSNLSGKSLTVNADIEVLKNVTDSGSWSTATGKKLTFNGTGDQSFTVNTSNTYCDIIVDKTSGTFAITGKLTADNFTSEKAITFAGDIEVETSDDVSFVSTVSSSSNLNLTAAGNVAFSNTLNTTGDLSVIANALTFANTVNVKNFTINAATTTSSDITVTGNWTNNKASGGFTASGGTVKLTTISSDTNRATLSGANTFYNLNLDRNISVLSSNNISNDLIMHRNNGDAPGKGNIYFAAGTKQTIDGSFDFKGLTTKRLLAACCDATTGTITTNGIWEIQCASASVQNVNLSNCNNSSGFPIIIEDPAGTSNSAKSSDGGNNTNFYFLNHAYTWNGSTDSNWNTPTNWTPSSIPGKGADVIIAEVTSPAHTLLLAATLDLRITHNGTDYNGKITVNSGAVFDLAGNNLLVGTFTNNGLVRLTGATGASPQTITAVMKNGTGSTVEYYGTGAATTNFAWDGDNGTGSTGKQYANLILNQNSSSSETLVMSENLTIKKTAALSGTVTVGNNLLIFEASTLSGAVSVTGTTTIAAGTGKSVSLNNASNTFTGHVTIGNSAASPAVNAGTVTLNGSGSSGSAIFLENNVLADSLTLNSNIQGATLSVFTVSGPLTVNTSTISTTENQTYNNEVRLTHNSIFSAPALSLIKFNNTLSSTNSSSCEIQNAASQFDGAVTNLSSLTTSATATFNAAINNVGTLTTQAVTFNENVSVGSLSTQAANLNYQTITTTTGGQTYNGAVTLGTNITLTAPVNMLINFVSTLNGSDTYGVITSTADSQFNGQISGLTSLTTDATATFNADISTTGTLTTQTAVINTANINTSDNQTFQGTVTVSENANLTAPTDKKIYFYNNVTGMGSLTIGQTGGNSAPVEFRANISLASDQTYNANVIINTTGTFSASAVSASGNIIFNKDIIANSGVTNVTFNTVSPGEIRFANSTVTILCPQTYNGPVNASTLTYPQADTINFAGTVTAGTLSITQAQSTNFEGAVIISTFNDTQNSGNISFNAGGTITAAGGQIFNTQSLVTFGNDATDTLTFGSETAFENLTHIAGITSITGTVRAANLTLANTAGGPITITNSGFFTITENSTLNYSTSFTQNGSGKNTFAGSFTGNGPATFEADILLYGTAASTFGSTGNNITIGSSEKKNLIISREADCAINATLTTARNIVLYKGSITLNGNLTSTDDILILGSNYNLADSSTGNTTEYAYNSSRPDGWSHPNYDLTNSLPDDSPAPESYTATLSIGTGNTITAGKNFYINGTSISATTSGGISTGQWNLSLPDLTNPENGFAESYHSLVSDCNVICIDGSTDGTKARLVTLECTDNGSNQNVDFGEFKIIDASTVRDNAIRVEFNRPVRYHSAMINSLAYHNANLPQNFMGFFSDPDCTTEINSDILTSYFYIKATPQDSAAKGAWNTDATGKSNGAADGKSSDRDGIHHSAVPCLDFPRALTNIPFIITDIWGKRLNNYSRRVPANAAAEPAYGSTESSYEVTDKTGPVLWTVRTGQELHQSYNTETGEASQHSYDSHNFLEFRYSEAVDFYDNGTLLNFSENYRVTDTLGAIQENITTRRTLTFAGLAKIADSKLYTGSQGSPDKYVNALYRPLTGSPSVSGSNGGTGGTSGATANQTPDAYSVRLSLAGWTNGIIEDSAGNEFKKWQGYIEEATQFTDKLVTAATENNTSVRDRSAFANPQTEYAAGSRTEPIVISSSAGTYTPGLIPVSPDLYSTWDLSSPVFTPLRFSEETAWGNLERSEAIGNTNGSGSTLDRIDFHFFDNTPLYSSSDAAEWFTEIGWCNPGSQPSKSNLKDISYTYCADIIGGARQFDTTNERRTSGGIRFSTKAEIAEAFKYSTSQNNTSPDTAFMEGIQNVHTTVISQLFTGSSAPMRPANDPDGLYLGLSLTDTNLSVETTFAFSYNESQGYLTDLAGNRLRSIVSKTIDRTPPSFDVILSPVDANSLYIIFVKRIITDSSKIKFQNNTGNKIPISEDFLSLLPKCFRLITIDENGNAVASENNKIDTSTPAQLITDKSSESFTCVKLSLTKSVTIDDITNLYVQLIMPSQYPDQSTDPLTSNINSHVTFIQDDIGNYMCMYSAHALSDFAINYVNPLYAYSSDMMADGASVMNGLYEEGSWAVHDWNEDQKNYGTLPAAHPISVVTALGGISAESVADQKLRIYLSPSPDEDSLATQFNSDFGTSLRVWLPEIENGVFRAISAKNNTNFVSADSEPLSDNSQNLIFNISKEAVTGFGNGSQVSFMFGVMKGEEPLTIYNSPYYDIQSERFIFAQSRPVPLFSLRMTDINDLNSIDLWSFKLKSITDQRGNVTILNNVIDAGKGEKTVVKVNVPEAGKLNVIVMTLDGNIITYLNRGKVDAGEHYFTWNGKNKNGDSVARGLYFIRVSSNGFDETRKVMVVKD